MSPRHLRRRTIGARERGAVLIQVALALTVLCGFCAMSIDYGLLMAARSQVQAAADAGALAGVIALGFDDNVDVSVAKQSAKAMAVANLVAQGSAVVTDADVHVDQHWVSGNGFPRPAPQPTALNRVTVSAYRNQARGNALPTFFGQLVGIGDQGVRATATAMMVPSNASDCVWPVAIPDRWTETVPPAPGFVKYAATGPPTLATPPDLYVPPSFTPPSASSRGTGFAPPALQGFLLPVRVVWPPLTLTDPWPLGPMNFTQPTETSRFVPVQVPRHDGGGFASNLASCNNSDEPVTIGDDDRLTVEAAGTLATVLAAAAERIAADSTATWNPTTLQVENSCAVAPTPCAPISPRLVVLPLFDLNRYEDTRWIAGVSGATPKIRVVNFVGFFIKQVTGTSIVGQLVIAPGRLVMGKPMVGYGSAFLRTTFLSR